MAGELDIRPLMMELANQGCQLCLPVVVASKQPLVFRAWRPGDSFEAGLFGTLHPMAQSAVLEPDVLIVPLLAVEGAGGWAMAAASTIARSRRSGLESGLLPSE